MTTTPNPTAEQIVYDTLGRCGMLLGTREHAARDVVERLCAAGLLVGDPTEGQIEAVARELACLDESDQWPTNAQLGGSLTGDRDMEYRSGMREQARDLLVVAARAAGVAPRAGAKPIDTASERAKIRPDSSHVARPEPESTDNGRCGGCRDLGPHRNVPGCDYYTPKPAPSPDREQRIGDLLRDAVRGEAHGTTIPVPVEDCEVIAAALAAQSVLDPEKVAEVYAHADADWRFEWDKFRSETGADPGPNADYIARVLCEAAKRDELT